MSEPTSAGRLGSIEACRGIAAATVVLYHAARHLNKIYGLPSLTAFFQFGHAGVDLFFVISGFIILYVHYHDIDSPPRLRHYIGRRFTRVMPTYWVALALTIFIAAGGHTELPSVSDLFWSVSLAPSDHRLLLGIAWTLRFELLFYAIFCILILHRITGLIVMAVWLAAIIVVATGHSVGPGPISLLTGTFNLEFFFGMAAAYTLRNRSIPAPKMWLMTGILLFAAVAISEGAAILDGYANYARLAYGIPSALIVIGAAEAGRQGRLPVPPPLRILGTASYSIYLFQFVFIGACWQAWMAIGLNQWMPHWAGFPLLALSGIVGGILMSRWIEYPLIRVVRGRRREAQPRAAIG
jgi:exopolysaccharide production protein ExoZ